MGTPKGTLLSKIGEKVKTVVTTTVKETSHINLILHEVKIISWKMKTLANQLFAYAS